MPLDPSKLNRIANLLTRAGHPGTPESEAITAARIAYKLVTEGEDDFVKMFANVVEAKATTLAQPYKNYYTKEKELEEATTQATYFKRENDKKAKQIIKLENELAILRERTIKKRNGDSVSYGEFVSEARKGLNIDKGWQRNFAAQTGISEATLNIYSKKGFVPIEVFVLTNTLIPVERVVFKREWTVDDVGKIREMTEDGHTQQEIADAFSKYFGVTITVGQIKNVIQKTCPESGKTQFGPEYGPPIRSRSRTAA